jgi:peptidyl-prolyl cis-trans isomerase C
VSTPSDGINSGPPELRYQLLRVALERFKRTPSALSPAELAQAQCQAEQTFDLETLVLGSPEAQGLVIPAERLDEALNAVAVRYPDAEAFTADLADNRLDETLLRCALHRELLFDAVMQQVGARRPEISEVDERLFYQLHRDRFTHAERRTARHILISVNDDFAENSHAAALARIEHLADRLRGRPNRFESLARRHSECPTALDGGRLGTVIRGQLYPELDAALFELGQGEVSGVVGSELGFHVLLCEKIHPGRAMPFTQVRERIRALLDERRRRTCQRAWIAGLQQAAAAQPAG